MSLDELKNNEVSNTIDFSNIIKSKNLSSEDINQMKTMTPYDAFTKAWLNWSEDKIKFDTQYVSWKDNVVNNEKIKNELINKLSNVLEDKLWQDKDFTEQQKEKDSIMEKIRLMESRDNKKDNLNSFRKYIDNEPELAFDCLMRYLDFKEENPNNTKEEEKEIFNKLNNTQIKSIIQLTKKEQEENPNRTIDKDIWYESLYTYLNWLKSDPKPSWTIMKDILVDWQRQIKENNGNIDVYEIFKNVLKKDLNNNMNMKNLSIVLNSKLLFDSPDWNKVWEVLQIIAKNDNMMGKIKSEIWNWPWNDIFYNYLQNIKNGENVSRDKTREQLRQIYWEWS
jgi:hypothetical protein